MELGREAVLALRRLGKAPSYSIVAVLSLTVAIGANSATFSAVHAVVLRPLPIREPERLVTCWETDPGRGLGTLEVSFPTFRDWRGENHTFEDLAAMGSSNWNKVLEGRGDPVRLAFSAVSASFFTVLGTRPILGRTFLPTDDLPGAEPVVVLDHAAWGRYFDGDPTVVGRAIILDKRGYTVVGVMPPDFQYPRGADFWTPLVPILAESSAAWKLDALEERGLGLLYVLGRLKPEATREGAAQDLDRIVRGAGPFGGRPATAPRAALSPFLDQFFGPVRRVLLWLFAAVGLVLLIACANVSGLMLTRATARHREDAIRLALGAGRGRVMRAWMLEACWLAMGGGLAGLLAAQWFVKIIAALAPEGVSHAAKFAVDWSVVVFTAGVCAVAALLCAVVPAWRNGSSVGPGLIDASRSVMAASSSLRSRGALTVAEVALAVVLLVAGGLTLRSFVNLRHLDLGYDPRNVLTMEIEPQGSPADHGRAYYRELLPRVASIPGVEAVGAVYLRPLALGAIGQEMGVVLEGDPQPARAAIQHPLLNYESVTPGYFRAMRIPLLRGRLFTERDDAHSSRVAVVGQSTARRLWPGMDPVGQRLATPVSTPDGPRAVWHTVVGVVKDARYRGLDEVRLDFYEPSEQAPPELIAREWVVRTTSDPLRVADAVRSEARALDSSVLFGDVTTMASIVGREMAPWRFSVWMFTLSALLSIVLATGGLFSLVALNVALRSREFAVRMALGARARDISGQVLFAAGRHATLGLALGVAASALGTRWLASFLFEVEPLDPGTYAGVIGVVLMTTAAASLRPAYRATRLDPVAVLREH
jgi:putative ABC transport system permease protein